MLQLVVRKVGGYSVSENRIKFDDEIMTMRMIQQSGNDNFLHFSGREEVEVISRFMIHTTVKLELAWFGEGKVYFEYSLEGSSDAIRRAREIC